MTVTRMASIPEAIDAFRRGEFIVVVDDEDRENEGDLIIAADAMTPEKMTFLVAHTSGVVVAPMKDEWADRLDLPLMVTNNTEAHRTAFTISVDVLAGTTTGISSFDRSRTLVALADPAAQSRDFARPGHIFPLRARPGGVLHRAGHTEAGVDFCTLAGRNPVAVLCEIVNSDGTMSRRPELEKFAAEYDLLLVSIADLVRYRLRDEMLVEKLATTIIPTKWGAFTAHAYRAKLDDMEHVALTMGEVDDGSPVLVRVHSECLTGDLLGSRRCDCGTQLDTAMTRIAERGRGVLVYLRGHEGRGIGLAHKLRAYELQDAGMDTVDANLAQGLPVDSREYGIGAQILRDLQVGPIELMTNNPGKYQGLSGYGIEISARVPIPTVPTPENEQYLRTKADRLGHFLEIDASPAQNHSEQ